MSKTSTKELMWQATDIAGKKGVSGGERGAVAVGTSGLSEGAPEWRRRVEASQKFVECGYESILNNRSYDSGSTYEEELGGAEGFRRSFSCRVLSLDEREMVVDLVGLHPALANALRRIIMAELPTMAIETVYVQRNTSLIPDEVLAHRLGLVPLRVNPDHFEYKGPGDTPTDINTLVFNLAVRADPHKPRTLVLSRDLQWDPQGNQEEILAPAPEPIEGEVLLAKLAGEDQEIRVTCHAHKGLGKDHMKFSPVAPVYYRLLPHISLARPFLAQEALRLRDTCPMGVFDVEDVAGTATATVARPRNCSLCRECIRDPAWRKDISVQRVKNHFIFTIESVGAVPPQELFRKALDVLSSKADAILQEFAKVSDDASSSSSSSSTSSANR